MNKRSKLAALLGAGLLTFGMVGAAFAADLQVNQVDKALSTFDLGDNCATEFPNLAEGQVGVHFQYNQSTTADGDLSYEFQNPSTSGTNTGADKSNGNGPYELQWDVVITGDGDTTIHSASTTAGGDGNLTLSHVCFGAAAPTPTPTLPGGGGAGDTDQPPTDGLAGSTGTSGPSDSAWLLVVGLGVLLASIVVLTPAKAKSRR
jgi:hypothetical protein